MHSLEELQEQGMNEFSLHVSRFRSVTDFPFKHLVKTLSYLTQNCENVKTKVIPVIIGATGTIPKIFRKYVSNMPGNHEVKELRKTAILGTARVLWKVLM